MAKKRKERFGEVAVGLGLATEEEIRQALERQAQLKQEGRKHKLIGMILLEMGVLSNEQLILALRAMQDEEGRGETEGGESTAD